MKFPTIVHLVFSFLGSLSLLGQNSTMEAHVYGGNLPSPPNMPAASYLINNVVQEYGGCGFIPSIHVAIIDSQNCAPWGSRWTYLANNTTYNPTHFYDNFNDEGACRNRVEWFFVFQQNNSQQMAGIERMLEDSVPNGYYILAYSWMYVNFNDWALSNPNLLSTFQTLGATNIGSQGLVPFIFFVQKGNPSSAIELYGQNINDSLFLTATLNCFPLGTSDMSNNSFSIQVIPNPSKGIFNCNISPQIKSFEVFDMLGNLIFSKVVAGVSSYNLDLSEQEDGLYFLKAHTEIGIVSKRLVLAH